MNKDEKKENTEDPIEGVADESEDPIEASGEGEAVEDQPSEKEPSLEEQLAEAKALADENYKNYLRAVADLDTYRRRVIREKDDLRQYAISGLLESILPIYDNMGLGLLSAEQAVDPNVVSEGIRMVITQFQTVLGENGIEEINPGKGDTYDHNLHEAVQTQQSDEVEAGAVLQLVRRGFLLNGRLIRPATVIVSGEASQ